MGFQAFFSSGTLGSVFEGSCAILVDKDVKSLNMA